VPLGPDAPLPPDPPAFAVASLPPAPAIELLLLVAALPLQFHVVARKRSDSAEDRSGITMSASELEQAACPRLAWARPLLKGTDVKRVVQALALALAAGCSSSAATGEAQVAHPEETGSDSSTDDAAFDPRGDVVSSKPDTTRFIAVDASNGAGDGNDASGDDRPSVAPACPPFPDFGCAVEGNNCEVGTPLRPVCVDGQYHCTIGVPVETCGPRFSCGPRRCFTLNQYCRHVFREGGTDEYGCASVPSACTNSSPTCACLASEPCGASCELSDGGLGPPILTCL
jgi:hypothetical protein